MSKENAVYTHTHTHTILLGHKKDEALSFATTGKNLKGIMLGEISQRKASTM